MAVARRYRDPDTLTLFSQGFRPFFFGAGLWSLCAVAFWLPVFNGGIILSTAFDPVLWHAHEMIFGFVGAVLAGFLLTAVPNWTGRMPLHGAGLAWLFGLWLAGRGAIRFSDVIGIWAAAAIDLLFFVNLLFLILREIVAGRNWRNLPMTVALGFLILGNALIHLDAAGIAPAGDVGLRLSIAVIVMLISLVGGRIVPSFTRNWLAKRGETVFPAPFGWVDRVALLITLLALAIWVAAPDRAITGYGLLAAAAVMAFRLAR